VRGRDPLPPIIWCLDRRHQIEPDPAKRGRVLDAPYVSLRGFSHKSQCHRARPGEEPERMNCPTCFGIGEVLIDKDGRPVSRLRDAATMIACPERGGCGKIHCCEGERAQPEAEE
jgi:hypothetical protein